MPFGSRGPRESFVSDTSPNALTGKALKETVIRTRQGESELSGLKDLNNSRLRLEFLNLIIHDCAFFERFQNL